MTTAGHAGIAAAATTPIPDGRPLSQNPSEAVRKEMLERHETIFLPDAAG